MAHSIGTDIGTLRPVLMRGVIFVPVFAAVYFLTFLMFGVGRSAPVPVRPVVSYDAVQAAYCSQFVDLARAKFGPEWKRRLDPRDTACAQQIQEAWEHEWNPREPLSEPVSQPTRIASAARPAKVAPAEAGPAHDPETYSPDAAAIINGAGAGFASADATDREGAYDSNYSSEHGRDPGVAAREDRGESEMGASEQGHDARRQSTNGYGANDDQTDVTRALNNEQLGGRAHDGDMQRPSDDDSDADENDDSRDKAPSRDSD